MITRLKLKPGQKGTKALVKEYGDALICVRYRYDETTRTRLKTVEIIIERKELPAPRQTSVDQRQTVADDALIPVHIAYDAKEQRKLARALTGNGTQT